jgi:hypothetical protein
MLRIIEACLISLTNCMVIIWDNASKSSSARVLLSESKNDRILSDIYEHLQWLLPADLHVYFSLCLIPKILKRQCLPYFNGTLRPNLGLASHDTRSVSNLYISNIRRTKYGLHL